VLKAEILDRTAKRAPEALPVELEEFRTMVRTAVESEGRATPRPCYGEDALRTWAERLAGLFKPSEDVYVYFNNDHRCCAVRDARTFAQLCRQAGLEATPVTAEARVAAG